MRWSSSVWRANQRSGGGRAASAAGAASRACAVAAPLLLIWLGLAPAVAAQTLDDRVYAVARQLMCPVCQGQTVAESDSALAREMKAIIRQKLEAGETPHQILRYFVGQFGESVLAEPPPGGAAVILYLAPPLALAAGVAVAVAAIRRWRKQTARLAPNPDAPPGPQGP